MRSSNLSELIQSDVPSNTLLLILFAANEFGTVFELDVQRLETLEEPVAERETISHNRFIIEAFTFTETRIALCLLPFLYRCNRSAP